MEVENDPEIERLGSKAAAHFMERHEHELNMFARSGTLQSKTGVFECFSDGIDMKRLYLTFRSNISHPVDDLGNGTILKSQRWVSLLMCMQGRIPDFNFITLLRPNASLSYQEQRHKLLVVPRAQFVLVEIARLREGCYDEKWWVRQRMHLSRAKLRLEMTKRFRVVSIAASSQCNIQSLAEEGKEEEEEVGDEDLFQVELKRQMKQSEENTAAARRGDQLKQCFSAHKAAEKLVLQDPHTKARLQKALRDLYSNKEGTIKYSVVDNVLSKETCKRIVSASLKHFEKIGDARIQSQAVHRGDDVCFIPLFESDLAMEAQAILGNIAALAPEKNKLLVPHVGQLALYDGVSRKCDSPGYVAHLDNCAELGGDGENYRELTAILYLNTAPEDGASGGELQCFEANEKDFELVVPKAGRLVIFPSRNLLHQVAPVVGWRRLALSVWILKDSRMKTLV